MDQAYNLRQIMGGNRAIQMDQNPLHIITVASGKGGVGKTNFSINFALAMQGLGKNPIVLDSDFGLSNVEVLLGEQPKHNLLNFLKGQCQINEIVAKSRYGVSFISGGLGLREMNLLPAYRIEEISRSLTSLSELTDTLIIDTGAGINDAVIKFCSMADEVYVVVTPDPSSITDSYALIKTLVQNYKIMAPIKLVINKTSSIKEAKDVLKKLESVCAHFLNCELGYAGYIPYDTQLMKAVKEQVPVYNYNTRSKSALAYAQVAQDYLSGTEAVLKESWRDKLRPFFQ